MDDRDRAVLADAWRYIPTGRADADALGSFSRTRIDRMIALLIGIACMVHGAQALTAAIQPDEPLTSGRLWVTIAGSLALLVMTIGCLINVFARTASAVFACVYLLVLLVWPFAGMSSQGLEPAETQWPFYLIDIAIAAAVVAFRLPLQVFWALAAPLLYGVARLVQARFVPEAWLPVASEVSFALLVGGALVALAWTIRSAAGNVDAVRGQAVSSYARAAAEDATENERVAVAALMHDSVLGALLAAERAHTPREHSLAVSMAREALSGLQKADADDGEMGDEIVDGAGVADELERALRDLGVELTVHRESDGGTVRVSGRVARVIVLAAMQAIANAVQHADAVGLAVTVRSRSLPDGVAVLVSDRGPGFDPDAVPVDRLGVRGSILARMASIGGHAHIQSGPEGTVVTIEWESGDRW